MFDTVDMLGKNIHVVEDSKIDRIILKKRLLRKRPELNVVESNNGKEAIEFYKNVKPQIDVVFLDINMPVMDGFSYLEAKQDIPEYKDVPVILLSSSDFIDDIRKALSFDCVINYIVKPITEKVVNEFLEDSSQLHQDPSLILERLNGFK